MAPVHRCFIFSLRSPSSCLAHPAFLPTHKPKGNHLQHPTPAQPCKTKSDKTWTSTSPASGEFVRKREGARERREWGERIGDGTSMCGGRQPRRGLRLNVPALPLRGKGREVGAVDEFGFVVYVGCSLFLFPSHPIIFIITAPGPTASSTPRTTLPCR